MLNRLIFLLPLTSLLLTPNSALADAEHSAEQCTTSTAQLQLLWMTVWENNVVVPCSELDAHAIENPDEIAIDVDMESTLPECELRSYLFGAVQWCSKDQE